MKNKRKMKTTLKYTKMRETTPKNSPLLCFEKPGVFIG